MNNDLKTTVTGLISGIAGVLLIFHVVLPDWISGLITAAGVAVLGYFTNKPDKPKAAASGRISIKTVVLLLTMISIFIAANAFAQTTTPAPTPAPAPATPTVSSLQTVFGSFNIGSDLVYLPRARQWEAGGGINLVSWNNLLNFRFQVAQGASGSPFFGGGINVNLVSLANLAGTNIQLSGVMKVLNPCIGIMPGYNSTPGAKKFDFPIVLSVIGVTF